LVESDNWSVVVAFAFMRHESFYPLFNAPFGNLFIFEFSQQFKLPKHHFKLRKKAQLSDLVFKMF